VVGLALLVGWCTTGVSRADIVQYTVSFTNPNAFQLDSASGPYGLDFFLTTGSTADSNTTSVSGSNFSGSGTGVANNFTLNNTEGEAEATSAFTPPTNAPAGSLLSFDLTANYTPGSQDTFSFGIYKNFGPNQSLIVTNEPAPLQQAFFTLYFSGAGVPAVGSYSSNESGFNIGAPTVTLVSAVPTPEPSTYAMMALGLVALCVLGAKRKK
jgi:hypothetical protein